MSRNGFCVDAKGAQGVVGNALLGNDIPLAAETMQLFVDY
jgi:hypothetical protein